MGGSGAMRSYCGAASGFERQRLLIALGFFCFQQQSRLQHSSIPVGSAPVPLMFLVHVRGAEPSPIYSLGRGKPLFVPVFIFLDDCAARY